MSIFHRVFIALVLLVFAFAALPGAAFAQSSDFYTDCEKFPGSLGCAPVGEPPAGDSVPHQTRNLELSTGPVFAGGSCPQNLAVHILGRNYTVLNMAQPCAWIVDYMRPIILLMAAISAVFIVLPKES